MDLVLCFLSLLTLIFAKDTTIDFIKKFIENENSPTSLVFDGLCWKKYDQLKLSQELIKMNMGVAAGRFRYKSKLQDDDILCLADLDCPNVGELFNHAILNKMFQPSLRWFILANSTGHSGVNVVMKLPLLADSDLTLAEKTQEGYKMTELHRIEAKGPMIPTIRGYYNGSLTDVRPFREMFRRRRNIMRHTIVMSNVIQDGNVSIYHMLKEDRLALAYDAAARMTWIGVKYAIEMMNGTPNYIISFRYGYKVDGRWSGMIKDLIEKKADIGTDCGITSKRLDVVDFADVLSPLPTHFVFRQPPLSFTSNIFSLPFHTDVWIAMVVCVAASALTFYATSKWESKIEPLPTQLDGSMSDALLLTLSAVTQQGCAIEPSKAPGRIMEFFLFTALMALFAAYSANIIVLLQSPANAIKNLEQLAVSSLTLAANDVDYNHFLFKLFNDSVRVFISNRVDPPNGKGVFFPINEGVERIRQGLFAFHSITGPVYRRIEDTFMESEKCDLTEINYYNSFDTNVPIQKGSPYLELFRVILKQIRESGIRSALSSRYQVPKPVCTGSQVAFSSVGIQDIRPVALFMLIGVGVSVAIMMLEVLVFNFNKKREKLAKRKTFVL